MAIESTDPALMATLLAIAMGLVKILESVVTWAIKRVRPESADKQMVVRLDSESSRLIRNTSDKIDSISIIVNRVDQMGTSLIYGPRTDVSYVSAAVERIEEKVDNIEKLTESIASSKKDI